MTKSGKLGILVGGGPAPGINSVIAAAAIRGELEGVSVVGIRNGFESLMQGSTDQAVALTTREVSEIHFRGGSILGTSRANPTKEPGALAATVTALRELGIDKLVTVGGDDTAFSAMSVARAARDRKIDLGVVHVPKTIDNDLDLPSDVYTFGFQTAWSLGTKLVQNVIADAQTTSRWYFIVAMGRKAGHLAFGMGMAAGATVTLIAEEWSEGAIPLDDVVDTLLGAIIKRRAEGRPDGVAVLAEGIVERLDEGDLAELADVERDEHGNIRIAEIDVGRVLKVRAREELAEMGLKVTIVSKNVGYELRCADPIAADLAYCRELGYSAADHLLSGGSDIMASMQRGEFVPVPFDELIDSETGRAKVRLFDIASPSYAIGRRYMTRLGRPDFEDADLLGRLAAAAGMDPASFRSRFEHVARHERPSPSQSG